MEEDRKKAQHKTDNDDISRKRHLEWWEACLCKRTEKYNLPRTIR